MSRPQSGSAGSSVELPFAFQKHKHLNISLIICPALLATGRDDMVCPVALRKEMPAAIPQMRLEQIEQNGHLSSLEQPEAVLQLLRTWLQQESR